MNTIQKQRLLNVALALREAPEPKKFAMTHYVNECGTPACALGHYAARTDLQRTFKITENRLGFSVRLAKGGSLRNASYMGATSLNHFGIDETEADQLFSTWGCNDAKTPAGAAQYIERFVARKEREARA